MYLTHFGLRQRPFPAVPDTICYYPATTHEDACNVLAQALADGEGYALLSGDPGTGKTLVAYRMFERLDAEATTVLVTNCHLARRSDLFQAILYDLGLPYEGRSEQELRLALTDHLLAQLGNGHQSVLVFDEAHHLPADLLEELRLLGNLETRAGKAVQVVLVGQPELLDTLKRPELAALAQRLAVRVRLEPLGLHESADYLLHHLRMAGARPEAIVTDEALEIVARGSRGLPRLLNQAAHFALALTCQAGSGRVDAEGAMEALNRLGLEWEPAAEPEDELPAASETHGSDDHGGLVLPPSALAPRLMYAPGR
jgi:type II secretory pathway predicted ATPase ExeA